MARAGISRAGYSRAGDYPDQEANIRDNGDGTMTLDYSDGTSSNPIALPSGPPGEDGQDGEVSAQQMNDAIGAAVAGTANNTNAVELLSGDADLATVIAKINELITAQRR